MNGRNDVRVVYRDLIRDAIYEQVVNGELKPGDRITELEWAKIFNTSQAPVREAIRDLEAMGVVVSIPFKGAFVREMTVKDLKDIHQIRIGLEGVALKNAILKASDQDIENVKSIFCLMTEYAKNGQKEEFIKEDIHFHEKIVELADTTELMKMWKMCNVELWTAFNVQMSQSDLVKFAVSHKEILDVLEKRQTRRAFEVMDEHFTEVTTEIYEG